MFPCNGKHSINRTALPKRTAPSPPCHSVWKSAWAIKQNPSFCLYLKFPLVFFSHTMWCWAEPVSVDCEWHMRIAGRDAVLVLFALFFFVSNSSSCSMLQKALLQNQEMEGFNKNMVSPRFLSFLFPWLLSLTALKLTCETRSLLPRGDSWNPWNIQC